MSALSEATKAAIRDLIPKYPSKQAVTLPALHLVHDEQRYVSTQAIVEIGELLDLHPAVVQDTMTFYLFFKDKEADRLGGDRVWVCRGLACMLRGAYDLIDHCEHTLGVTCGHRTADGRVTLEFAECIGACDGAPAVLLNDKHVMDVTPEKADRLFASLGKAGA